MTALSTFVLFLSWYDDADVGGLAAGLAVSAIVGVWTCKSTEKRHRMLKEEESRRATPPIRPDCP